MEAERIDSEFMSQDKLTDKIDRLSFILEHQDIRSLSGEGNHQELERESIEALKFISDFKDALKL